MKTILVTTVAALTALAPGAASAAPRHALTLDTTARTSADGSRAVLSGTYTCEGFTGSVRLRIALRTQQTRPLTAAETETVKNLYQWLGIPGTPVPKTSTANTAIQHTFSASCDGSATAHPWERGFSGAGPKGTKASVTVTMLDMNARTPEENPLARTSADVTFA
ncbi:hypothetical protein ACFYO9_27025 [Streptomyces sp. NPDC005863]|uniref:hypothetical protein n=1 Tax=unclassified Streptomyces TaxID=2593676 RepID=UPI0033D9D228